MADLRCPVCGRPSCGLCAECYLKDHPIAVKPEPYKECGCGGVLFKGKWFTDKDEMIRQLAERSIRPPSGVRTRIEGVKSEEKAGKLTVQVDVVATCEKASSRQDISFDVWPERVTCDTCKKLSSGYYEAVLQVRDSDIDLNLDGDQVSNVEKVRGGFDYYLTSVNYAREKVTSLFNKGYFVKDSSKLFGRKGDKVLYRHYFSIKHPQFRKGDFIEHKGKLLQVRDVGRSVKLTDVESGKHESATLNQLEDAPVIAKSPEVKTAIITEVRPDGIQIMNSQDCSIHELPRRDGVEQGQEVKYIHVRGRRYLLF
ncbi:MAG: NMD3-related protein [Candidatus Altiarchaeota archaeon]